jgi:hypothetical protein
MTHYTQFIMICDIVSPSDPQGRTYRQINAAKKHNIPVGALVEIIETGVRLFVVRHSRDCDQTPLYCLAVDQSDTVQHDPRFYNDSWQNGYAEVSLRVVGRKRNLRQRDYRGDK